MTRDKNSRLFLVWLGLVGITALSWLISVGDGHRHGPNAAVTAAVLVISAIKARFIMRDFMEVGHASTRLKRLTDGWLLFTLSGLLAAYLFGTAFWRWMEINLLHLL